MSRNARDLHCASFTLNLRIALIVSVFLVAVIITAGGLAASRSKEAATKTTAQKQRQAPEAVADPAAKESLKQLQSTAGDQVEAHVSRQTQKYNFVRAKTGAVLSADDATMNAGERALKFLSAYGGVMGISSAERQPAHGRPPAHRRLR